MMPKKIEAAAKPKSIPATGKIDTTEYRNAEFMSRDGHR